MNHERHNPPPEWRSFEDVVAHSKEHLLQHGTHLPMVIVDGERQSMVVGINDLPDTAAMRIQHLFVVGYAVAQADEANQHLKQLFLITEGWLSIGKAGNLPHLPPSEDPDRHEVLLIMHLRLKERQSRLAAVEILRDEQGNIHKLNDLKPPQLPDEPFESPLLLAFAAGYQAGRMGIDSEGEASHP